MIKKIYLLICFLFLLPLFVSCSPNENIKMMKNYEMKIGYHHQKDDPSKFTPDGTNTDKINFPNREENVVLLPYTEYYFSFSNATKLEMRLNEEFFSVSEEAYYKYNDRFDNDKPRIGVKMMVKGKQFINETIKFILDDKDEIVISVSSAENTVDPLYFEVILGKSRWEGCKLVAIIVSTANTPNDGVKSYVRDGKAVYFSQSILDCLVDDTSKIVGGEHVCFNMYGVASLLGGSSVSIGTMYQDTCELISIDEAVPIDLTHQDGKLFSDDGKEYKWHPYYVTNNTNESGIVEGLYENGEKLIGYTSVLDSNYVFSLYRKSEIND